MVAIADLGAHFGPLKPGTYRFQAVLPAGSYRLKGLPKFSSGDLKSPVVKLTVRPTSLDDATKQLKRGKEVEFSPMESRQSTRPLPCPRGR